MVALCNSRAMGEHEENSDIDLFIIATKWNLWTARFIVTVLTSVLGVRRRNTHGLVKWSPEYIKKTKNKFCLSFFITEEAMNLESIRLQPNDPYLDKWMRTLQPLINKNGTYERFLLANKVVILGQESPLRSRDERDPGIQENQLREASTKDIISGLDSGSNVSLTSSMKTSVRNDGNMLEWLIRKLWLPRTLRTYEKLWRPWWVVISDTMLKFHDDDQRKMYRDNWFSEPSILK